MPRAGPSHFESLEPLRQGHGSQFVADDRRAERTSRGRQSLPAFAHETEGKGCVERFIRVRKENPLRPRRFATAEGRRHALHSFKDTYHQRWILQRNGYRTPVQVRADQITLAMAA
jgi:transposase InsO family protein